jgi:hypothetical protein
VSNNKGRSAARGGVLSALYYVGMVLGLVGFIWLVVVAFKKSV